jgi:hypothetical protein
MENSFSLSYNISLSLESICRGGRRGRRRIINGKYKEPDVTPAPFFNDKFVKKNIEETDRFFHNIFHNIFTTFTGFSQYF